MVRKLLCLALAGALGTIARYGLAGFIHRINGASFPWGTVVVNLSGCFLAGNCLLVLFVFLTNTILVSQRFWEFLNLV